MQFAGRRTDMDLQPIGEPVNVLIKLTPDVVPEPDAIMVTGITPQSTLADGITEAEFLKLFYTEVAIPDTIFVGFNTVRFDDEFMRFLMYRNFYDPYEWCWKDGRSRWDILDVVRMTRALRPEGIEWPFAPDGKPTVRLEYMTKVNNLLHESAHDALSDVDATIAVAQLIKSKQPKLFDYLLAMRDKKKVEQLVLSGQPLLYTSGRYTTEHDKTNPVVALFKHPSKQAAVMYNLRVDPTEFLNLSVGELIDRWKYIKEEERAAAPTRLPAKTLQFNRCPAIAPMGNLDKETCKRLSINTEQMQHHKQIIDANPEFKTKLLEAVQQMETQQQTQWLRDETDVDGQLYDGFYDDHDCKLLSVVRAADPSELASLKDDLHDSRLQALLPLYKARNYPTKLDSDERAAWDEFCKQRLIGAGAQSPLAKFAMRLQELAATKLTQNQQYLLEELRLYAESITPAELDG